MTQITIIGRGHSGTRAISHTLSASGVYMGHPLNRSGDLLPPQPMYDACRVMAEYVEWRGGLEWDFSKVHSMPIPQRFTDLIHEYLQSLDAAGAPRKGWKIPETTLVFPWILRMFPETKYIFWVRNPRDCILGRHLTDDLADFGIDYPRTEDERERRAISWIYQYKLVKATPRPRHWLEVRLEDFVRQQEQTLARLEEFLGFPLASIPVRPEAVDRWAQAEGVTYYDFLAPAMEEFGYTPAVPEPVRKAPAPSDKQEITQDKPRRNRTMASRRQSRRRPPNIVLLGIDSLRRDHMSCYGYPRLTTPHIDRFAQEATLFEQTFSAHIPTTSAYASMLTGMDVFSTQVVALRHQGPLRSEVQTLAEILSEEGYNTSCVGFTGNPSSRGFDNYLEFEGWGSWNEGRSPKAQNLNEVAIPEMERLAKKRDPFFLFLRHMDPHAPYLPPEPFERAFYHGNEVDPRNKSMDPVMDFKPFRDFFASWMPPGITDKDYVVAQYDGAIAYMDAAIRTLFTALEMRGLAENTIVVINGDHGETLYDHECWFDHHGLYDPTLVVPLIIRYPGHLPAGRRVRGYNQHKDLVPTLMDLANLAYDDIGFDGHSLVPMVQGEVPSYESEFYITECTWMRKHGWRTPHWKLIRALEPDFHFKPAVELYNLVEDPEENHNLAEQEPSVVDFLTGRMQRWIERREKETGLPNPIHHQGDWHGKEGVGAFKSSQEAYDTLHIGDPTQAAKLQAESRD